MLPDQLSTAFKRFYNDFSNYLAYILQYDYEILPEL